MDLENKTVLMLMAHPDDEIIFGWPILQNFRIKKKILCCSSDLNNKDREWCKHRKFVLMDVCKRIAADCRCLDYNSEFYRLETRQETLSAMMRKVEEQIQEMEPFDYIYSHNAWGEYGHMDHVVVNMIAMNLGYSLVVSNMFLPSNWVPFKRLSRHYDSIFFDRQSYILDLNFYSTVKSLYSNAAVWTWSKDPIRECLITEVPK